MCPAGIHSWFFNTYYNISSLLSPSVAINLITIEYNEWLSIMGGTQVEYPGYPVIKHGTDISISS